MSHQVNIHIHHDPITADETRLTDRVINLNPTQRVLQIGRASKSPIKGLAGATNNAWFDSPVMSRNHAEILYNPSDNVIQIRDIGSMHGTFVNGEKLDNEAKALKINDRIVFGITVRRGMDSFPPCHFNINYEVLPWKKPHSYAVPDSSDDEDEGYNYSDEDMSEGVSSQDGASIKMIRCSTVAQSIDAIDLTGDDIPGHKFESTEPSYIPAARKPEEQEFAPKSPVLDSPMTGDNTVIINSNPKSNYRNDRRQERTFKFTYSYKSDDDEDMNLATSDLGCSDLENVCDRDEDDEDSDSSEDSNGSVFATKKPVTLDEIPSSFPSVYSSRVSSPVHRASKFTALSSPGLSANRPANDPLGLFDNENIPESHVRTQIHTSEEVVALGGHGSDEEGDDDGSVGLSEAADEGLRILVKDGLLDGKPVNTHFHSRDRMVEDNFSDARLEFTAPRPTTYVQAPMWSSFDREASPSAVAMVKAPGPSKAEHSVDQTSKSSWDLSKGKAFAKSLGIKIGKHAFFEAREDNKMQFQPHVDREEKQGNQYSPSPIFTEPDHAVKFGQPLVQFTQPIHTQPMKYHGNGIDHGFMIKDHSISGSEIKDREHNIDEPHTHAFEAASGRLFNFKSAEERRSIHPYYFSSDASSRAPESPALERHPARSGLRIDDIIDGSSTCRKRKADEISDDEVIESEIRKNEVRDWASSVVVPEKPVMAQEAVSEVTPEQFTPQATRSALATTKIELELRPIKRPKMKKFAEAVGYFALGGAAVGAGLFSALVATAPDFL
ncbi:78ea0c9a-8812-41e0-8f71-b7e5f3781694 [Sclerotinia trifoliorum]|uniref:78ea0c9a-8812-41e0-8f71-b7e5f3781694 n=1 Tax=Sclerotinia trifoliorum TaxID=28548 RepID=A0A8H2VUD0_9HELO|nr:78ea0c9a-8812-41e0-8f71-b7e5f3781694 [Sclerotinia trifoliorum]